VPPQPILKALPAIFLHADKSVRAEGTTLAQTCYRYIGPALDAFLAPLKPVQIKELKESFAEADSQGIGHGTAQQQRFTRDQQREKAIQETQSTLDGQSAAPSGPPELPDEPQVDVHDLVDPSDVKIPADFYDKLASSKWKERKEEALDPLLKVLQVPKIADSDFGELVRALAGRMTDANIACVTAAANCLEALALGLRQLFERYRSMVVVPVLERLKEKKQSVADALGKCLDAVAASAHLSDLVEDIATYAKHKNPQIKGETLKWLVRCLRSTRDKPTPADVKGLMAALLPALEDGSEPVRSAAQESVGTLMKIVGERAMAPHLAALDDLRKAKIQEFYDKAEVKAKAALGPAPSKAPPAPAPAKAAPQKRAPPVKADSPPPVKMPAKALAPSKVAPPAVKKAAPPTAAPSAKAPTKPGTVAEPIKLRFTAEEAEGMFASVLPTELLASLADSNWKSRLAAMDSLLELAQSDTALEAELIVRCVSKKPGWKESNFQVRCKTENG
jgi:cytoskeleton-associated protein 5